MKISAKAAAAIASALAVALACALLLAGAISKGGGDLPDGPWGWLATQWRAGDPEDCRLCPAHLFVVVCDAGTPAHIRDLRRLAALMAEQRQDPQAWARTNGGTMSCIETGNFRLRSPSGGFGAAYDADDPGFRWDLSYRLLRDDAAGQVVEVRYRDSRTDIDDALFRYEVLAGTIRPLESRVLARGHVALALAGAIGLVLLLVLGWGLYFAAGALRRVLARRRSRRGGS